MLLHSTGNICMQVALVFILPPFLFLTLILSYLTLILSYIPYTYLQIITHVGLLPSQPCKISFFPWTFMVHVALPPTFIALRYFCFYFNRYFHHHGYSTATIHPTLTQHPLFPQILRCMFLVCTMR